MLLILVFQFLWVFIDDLIGKGLEVWVLIKLIAYTSATLLPLCMPVGVLFASLISFGSMGEHFELVSIKAAGISFARFLRPTFILGLAVSVLAFLIANYLIPQAHKRYTNLFYSIIVQKPALNLKEWTFYDKIDDYIIRVKHKSKDGKILYDLVLIEKNKKEGTYDNIIFAERGTMELTDDNEGLVFTLYNGYYYQEQASEDAPDSKEHDDLYRISFKKYVRVLKVSGFGLKEYDNKNVGDFKTMRIDELDKELYKRQQNFYITPTYLKNTISTYIPFLNYVDIVEKTPLMKDTANEIYKKACSLIHIEDSSYYKVKTALENKKNAQHSLLEVLRSLAFDKGRFLEITNRLRVEWHRKISLSFSCFVFIIIGASLGAIIRKGGIGLPLLIAVSFFIFYYFSSSSLEKIAIDPQGALNAFFALWLMNLLLLPVGLFLSYKVLNDARITSSYMYRCLQKIWEQGRGVFIRRKHKVDFNN